MMCPNWCDRDHSGRDFDDDADYGANHHRTVIDTISGDGDLVVRVAVMAPIEAPEHRQIEVSWADRDDPNVFLEVINFEQVEMPQLLEALQHAGALAADPSIAGEPRAAV